MIVKRPLTHLETICIAEAVVELEKEQQYVEARKQIKEDENWIQTGQDEIIRIRENEYCMGFWAGQRMQEILERKLREGQENK